MVIVATLAAYAVLQDSKLTIIPLALQSFGYAYGSLLAVFLLGMLTKRRGRDETNVLGMVLGVASVLVLCKVKLPAIQPARVSFFRAFAGGGLGVRGLAAGLVAGGCVSVVGLVGCLVCFAVSFMFATPGKRVETAERLWPGPTIK